MLPLVNTIHNSTPPHPSPLWWRRHFIAKRVVIRMVVLGFGIIGINSGMAPTLLLEPASTAKVDGKMWKRKQDSIRRQVLSVYINLHREGVLALSCLSFLSFPFISSKDFQTIIQGFHYDHYSRGLSFNPPGCSASKLREKAPFAALALLNRPPYYQGSARDVSFVRSVVVFAFLMTGARYVHSSLSSSAYEQLWSLVRAIG
jgi:hypothetical protein